MILKFRCLFPGVSNLVLAELFKFAVSARLFPSALLTIRSCAFGLPVTIFFILVPQW